MQENVGVNCLGNYYGLGQSFDGAVFGSDGIAPALLASNAHGNAPKIVEIIKIFIKGVDKVNEQNTIAKSRAEQSRAEQSRAEQSRAEQSLYFLALCLEKIVELVMQAAYGMLMVWGQL